MSSRIRPTALGVKALAFFVLLTVVFFAASYSNLFFLLLVFAGALAVLNIAWTSANLRGVTAEVVSLEPVPAGATPVLQARIDPGHRPRVALEVELELEGKRRLAAPVAYAHEPADVAGCLPALSRGVYRVVAARVSSVWPLGLLRASRVLEAPGELVVYPEPAGASDATGGIGALAGDAGGETRGQPAELREFRPGDELRNVHWRATARRGVPVVLEWEGAGGSGHEVVLDRRAEPEPFERALSLLSALVVAARDEKEPLTLHTQDLSATFGPGHRPWPELLRVLAAAQPLPAAAPAPPLTSPSVLRLPEAIA